MEEQQIIYETADFVRKTIENGEKGHDWHHIQRVWDNSKKIMEHEEADSLVVQLGVLLHDIADSKFHDDDETIGPRIAREHLSSLGVEDEKIDHVVKIIQNISFRGSLYVQSFKSKELDIVQDADRLDAMGAIGIARAFHFGGFKNRKIFDPDEKIMIEMDKEAYSKNTTSTINHFYEKLFLLKDRINTPTAKKLAEHRHKFMQQYLDEFYKEVNGDL